MSAYRVLGRLLAVAAFGLTVQVGCQLSKPAESSWPEPNFATGRVGRATLISDIKATYERRIQASVGGATSGWRVFDDQRELPVSALQGAALKAASEYEETASLGARNVGSVVVKVGTIDGETIVFVAGDLSETGTEFAFYDASGNVHRTVSRQRKYPRSEYGFYDASGALLARAYRGQGENPNARGVDWID